MHKEGEVTVYDIMTPEERRITEAAPWVKPGVETNLADAAGILALLPKPPATVLELGCGNGWLCHMMALCGYEVVGFDVCKAAIEVANKQVCWCKDYSNATFFIRDWDKPRHEKCDVIVFNSSLHHCIDREITLKMVHDNLKLGGMVIINEPGLTHGLSPKVKAWSKRANVTERSIAPFQLLKELRDTGFGNIKVYPKPSTLFRSIYSPSSFKCYHPTIAYLAERLPLSFATILGKWIQGLVTATRL